MTRKQKLKLAIARSVEILKDEGPQDLVPLIDRVGKEFSMRLDSKEALRGELHMLGLIESGYGRVPGDHSVRLASLTGKPWNGRLSMRWS